MRIIICKISFFTFFLQIYPHWPRSFSLPNLVDFVDRCFPLISKHSENDVSIITQNLQYLCTRGQVTTCRTLVPPLCQSCPCRPCPRPPCVSPDQDNSFIHEVLSFFASWKPIMKLSQYSRSNKSNSQGFVINVITSRRPEF